MQDSDLDQLLARAAAAPPPHAPGLLDRVLTDALAEQDRIAAIARPKPYRSFFGHLFERLAVMLGGPPMLAGVFTAAIAGVALGYLEPGMLDLLTGGERDLVDLFPEVDFLTTEG